MYRSSDREEPPPRAPQRSPLVIAFGPGPLRQKGGFARAAGALYRARREGRALVAMVPAAAGEDPATGTADAVARLAGACDRIGLPAAVCEVVGRPANRDVSTVRDRLEETGLVILSGAADSAGGEAAALAEALDGSHVRPAESEADAPQRPLRVKLAGYGVVGQALAERLRSEAGFALVSILVRDAGRARRVDPPCPVSSDGAAFLAEPADILVDLLSCATTSSRIGREELARGGSMVSASKQAISGDFARLSECARAGGARLLYSAAVGGSMPILETVDRARGMGRIDRVDGILNGTVNFILGRLADGRCYADALAEAQERGFAEADPEADISGADVQAKLRLVAARATDCPPDRLAVPADRLTPERAEAIRASGERWVQRARLSREGERIEAEVRFVPLDRAGRLPAAEGEWNCAAITLADGRQLRCTGRGAGGPPTAEAVLADLHSLRAPAAAANGSLSR